MKTKIIKVNEEYEIYCRPNNHYSEIVHIPCKPKKYLVSRSRKGFCGYVKFINSNYTCNNEHQVPEDVLNKIKFILGIN